MAKIQLFDYQRPTSTIGEVNVDNSLNNLALIQDTYSGKYYGEQSYEEIAQSIESAKQYFSSVIKDAEKPNYLGIASGGGTTAYNLGTLSIPRENPVDYAKTTLESLNNFTLAPENYVQKEQMLKSYDKYSDNWESYFEGNYKNPRLAEANEVAAARGKNPLTIQGSGAVADNTSTTRRTTGTGIASAGSINPFGTLDSGLNI
jgi:hypothetical protein